MCCKHIAQKASQFWARHIRPSRQHTTQEITLLLLSVAGWSKSKTHVPEMRPKCVCLGHKQNLCPCSTCSLGQRWACVGSLTWCSWLRADLPDPTFSWHWQTLVPFWLNPSDWIFDQLKKGPFCLCLHEAGASRMSTSGFYWCIGWKRFVHLSLRENQPQTRWSRHRVLQLQQDQEHLQILPWATISFPSLRIMGPHGPTPSSAYSQNVTLVYFCTYLPSSMKL